MNRESTEDYLPEFEDAEIEVVGIRDSDKSSDFDPEQYESVGSLGSGAYGIVSKHKKKSGSAEQLPQFVALKIIALRDGSSMRELDILKECDHQNVLTLYHWNIVQVLNNFDHLYMYTELCDTNLRKFMNDKELSRIVFELICHQIIQGCDYLHSKRIVHRDIKPENILINYKDSNPDTVTAKIADFGLARSIPQYLNSSFQLTAVGTRQYSSPEIFRAFLQNQNAPKPVSPFTTDIFSLGVVIYEMSTKKPPFSIQDLFQPSFNVDVTIRKNITDPMLLACLPLMLQWDPALRPGAKDLSDFFSLTLFQNAKELSAACANMVMLTMKEMKQEKDELAAKLAELQEIKQQKTMTVKPRVRLQESRKQESALIKQQEEREWEIEERIGIEITSEREEDNYDLFD